VRKFAPTIHVITVVVKYTLALPPDVMMLMTVFVILLDILEVVNFALAKRCVQCFLAQDKLAGASAPKRKGK
jgi:hypothetical protein